MGLGVGKLYVTNLGDVEDIGHDQLVLSEWCPIQHCDENGIWYSEPAHTPLGKTLFNVPNFLNIEPADGSFEVVLEPSQEETGLYAIDCKGDYFAEEVWLCNYKPKFMYDDAEVAEMEFSEIIGDDELHINMDLGTKKGDIINVKYRKKGDFS